MDAWLDSNRRESSRREEQTSAEQLYARLGRLLFERTKVVEEYYLLDPELYLALELACAADDDASS